MRARARLVDCDSGDCDGGRVLLSLDIPCPIQNANADDTTTTTTTTTKTSGVQRAAGGKPAREFDARNETDTI